MGNLLCNDKQCADVFSVCISVTVWAAACRTSVLLCGNLTQKEKNTPGSFCLADWIPSVTNALCWYQTTFDQVLMWTADFNICPIPAVLPLPLDSALQSLLLFQLWFKNQSGHGKWDELKVETRSCEQCAASDPGLVIVWDFLAENWSRPRVPLLMFFRETSISDRIL